MPSFRPVALFMSCSVLILTLAVLQGCAISPTRDPGKGHGGKIPISVATAPATANVTAGSAQTFTATVTGDSTNQGVSWSLSGAGCSGATCGSLTNATATSVTYTAPPVVPSPAAVTLTAKSLANPADSSSSVITVVAAVVVSVSPSTANVAAGLSQNFTASVTGDPANKGVTWTLSGAGCAGSACGTLTKATLTGVTYTAPSSLPSPAVVTLTATSVADTAKSASAKITVLAAIAVNVSPSSASLTAGQTQNFKASVSNDPANKGVTWSLSGSGCSGAGCGTLTQVTATSVTYAAPASMPSPVTVTLKAASVTDPSKSASATITVVSGLSVSLSPTTAKVTTGQTQNFTATVSSDPANKGVTWTLSGAACIGTACGTLSNSTTTSVTYTAPASVSSPGTVTLTATSVADATKSASATITVAAVAIGVSVSPTTANVTAGKTQNFNATVSNDPANKGVTWSLFGSGCSGAACGTLTNTTSTGVTYIAPPGAPSGIVTLTATSLADNTKSASANITVSAAPISVSVAPTTASVTTGQTQNFNATVSNDPANKGVTWSLSGGGCSGTTCGALTNTPSTGVTYTAPSTAPSGSVTLTATSVSDNTKTASARITISGSSGSITVSVSPKRAGAVTGQDLTLTATVKDSAGVTWSIAPSGGSFNPQTSDSGQAVTFTAPSRAGVYTVTATSVTDGSASASITIGVTDLPGVFTYHNDTSRDGINSQEYALTPQDVNTSNFGKLFTCQADGAIYAQPLWVPNVTIGGGKHNVIVAATARDSVYVFDADANPCVTYWHQTLIPSGETYGNWSDVSTHDIYPDIGIIGTPVIDPQTDRIYVIAKTKVVSTGVYHQRLYALNLADGSDAVNPVDLTSSLITIPGTGDTCTDGLVSFCPEWQNQRPGLALVNGSIYAAWAAHEDHGPYHGWVVGFSPSNLSITGIYNESPNGSKGGIWMSGAAPAADSSDNLYVITANGDYDGKTDFGDSFLKLATGSGLELLDSFTPSNQETLAGTNTDLSAGAAMIVADLPSSSPVQHLIIGGGKQGELYVLNRDHLGGYDQGSGGTDDVVQEFSLNHAIVCAPVFYLNTLFIGGVGGPIEALALDPSTSMFNPVASSETTKSFQFPVPGMSISSSGNSNEILWATDSQNYGTYNGATRAAGVAVLHAYDATNLSDELWNSTMVSTDAAGNAVKFTVPTVANGKVYIGTRGNDTTEGGGTVFGELDVYGLKP
jgi:hypothetical protein